MPKIAMASSKQQNEASKKNCESMSYATLYESMSMYAKSKTSNEFVNCESDVYQYECMSMYVKSKTPNEYVNYESNVYQLRQSSSLNYKVHVYQMKKTSSKFE
jgi:hypothetical protein